MKVIVYMTKVETLQVFTRSVAIVQWIVSLCGAGGLYYSHPVIRVTTVLLLLLCTILYLLLPPCLMSISVLTVEHCIVFSSVHYNGLCFLARFYSDTYRAGRECGIPVLLPADETKRLRVRHPR